MFPRNPGVVLVPFLANQEEGSQGNIRSGRGRKVFFLWEQGWEKPFRDRKFPHP